MHVLAMVLAGGEGKRLFPLTADRAKPAVPFGGNYRLIDFALSNLVNGGIFKIVVLTQYKSHSLDRHIAQTWRLSAMLNNYVASVPAQMRRGPRWFAGSADAIFQNLNLIYDERPDYILVFGADNIYRMDPQQMLEHHIASNYVAISPQGGRLDKAAALAQIQRLHLDDYTLGDVQGEMNSDTFVVTYTVAMHGTFGGQPLPIEPLRMMTVWQKEKAGWMAIAHSVLGPENK